MDHCSAPGSSASTGTPRSPVGRASYDTPNLTPNPRAIAHVHFKAPFESSNPPGTGTCS